jgi:hypothetical protein
MPVFPGASLQRTSRHHGPQPGIGVKTHPPANGSQKSIVHAFPSSQESTTFSHAPAALQASAVHGLLSSHSASLAHPVGGIGSQLPVAGSHASQGGHFGVFTQPTPQ